MDEPYPPESSSDRPKRPPVQQHRSERPVLLAVDQKLGEDAVLLQDPI
jgi:hypothetical protein